MKLTKEELNEWFMYYTQYINGYYLSDEDKKEFYRLNHIVLYATGKIQNSRG